MSSIFITGTSGFVVSNLKGYLDVSYIISEFNPHFDKNWFINIESNTNIKGTIFWNMHPHELGYSRGLPVEHNDGYTLHYPENRVKLLIISNHFRRMQGLPEITEL